MDAKLIEKLDRQRYWAVVVQAATLVYILVHTVWEYTSTWRGGIHIRAISSGNGVDIVIVSLLFLIAGVWYMVIAWRINRKRELRSALCNEMYITYKRLSQRITLWVVMLGLFAGILWAIFTSNALNGYPYCYVVFITGLTTLKLSWLILNRERRLHHGAE